MLEADAGTPRNSLMTFEIPTHSCRSTPESLYATLPRFVISPGRLDAGTARLAIGSRTFSAAPYSLRALDQTCSMSTESLQSASSTFRVVTASLEIVAESLEIVADTLRIGTDTVPAGSHTFHACVATLRIVG
jgi:hypothetical protein